MDDNNLLIIREKYDKNFEFRRIRNKLIRRTVIENRNRYISGSEISDLFNIYNDELTEI